jgi:hypothetical protein
VINIEEKNTGPQCDKLSIQSVFFFLLYKTKIFVEKTRDGILYEH